MNNKNNSQIETVTKTKTYNVYHIEDMGDYSERYYHGTIEAKNLDEAENQFIDYWLEDDYNRDNLTNIASDEEYTVLEVATDYYNNGELLTDEAIEELEKKYDMELTDMIDNFDLEGVDIGYITHSYEISLDGVNEDYSDSDEDSEDDQ